ncbi:sensor histidine kinase [Geomonas paludis]|uniref:histidine kinase n=1 Tax=Geomonas paludis TaxID=2740185 RepID=A0A6V8MVQ2_9BACT|nr:PAS domain S-box protein [Geomonas paludis]GFO63643.1 hypothetical protein GMPD_15620 [Geomonas paludis]
MVKEAGTDTTAARSEHPAPEQANEKLEEHALFERLFEKSPDAVLVVDGAGVIVKVNQHTEALFGYRREDLIGRHVEILIPDRFRARHRQDRRHYVADPQPRKMGSALELYGKHSQGWEIPLDIMLVPIECGERRWILAVARDITQQKRYEADLRHLNAQLQSQIEQLTAANKELADVSYTISHDLRAPLRHVIGFAEMLMAQSAHVLEEKSRHFLDVIMQSSRKMADQVDGLLVFAQLRRIEVVKARIDLNRMVGDIVTELARKAEGRDIEWQVPPLPTVAGDPEMLRLVMFNLLANAVKFTQSRSLAKIEVGALDESEATVIFVRDNGVGFDGRYVNKLFGMFQRLHAAEEFEGTGIGLANVRRIIERHGGRIWAEGAVDVGATFRFSLPKA